MPPIVIELAGEVVAKGRPRFAMRGVGQCPVAYTPDKTRKYEADLKIMALKAMRGRTMLTGSVRMIVLVTLPKVPSSKRRWPTVKPDLDNYLKTIQDALTGEVFADDKQICSIVACKRYGDNPGLRVEIEEML